MDSKPWLNNDEKTTEVTSDVENTENADEEDEYESDAEESVEADSDEESVHDLETEILYSDSEDDNDVVIDVPVVAVVKQKVRQTKDKTIKTLEEEAYIE